MGVPVSQMWTVASYVLGQKIRRNKRYPLVLMLEPLFRCNFACAGCGKIQYPAHILKQDLPLEDALRAVDECGTRQRDDDEGHAGRRGDHEAEHDDLGDVARQARDVAWVPWVTFGIIGLTSAAALVWLRPALERRQDEIAQLEANATDEALA